MTMSPASAHGPALSASTVPAATSSASGIRYELRYVDLFDRGRGFAFPCDAEGRVDMEELSDRALANYLFARALVGKQLSRPMVLPVD